mgnify:CR=1 FL=1|tara:strand:+ start:53 stop:280 length:228 start_codon:yes stop_codon:yes gene_type:complete
MTIDKIITIGNGEKCPYCDLIITADINSAKHLLSNHAEQTITDLFGPEETNEERVDRLIQEEDDEFREGERNGII